MSYISATTPLPLSDDNQSPSISASLPMSLQYQPLTTDPLPLLVIDDMGEDSGMMITSSTGYETLNNHYDEYEDQKSERTSSVPDENERHHDNLVPFKKTTPLGDNNNSEEGEHHQYTNKMFDLSNIDGIPDVTLQPSAVQGNIATISTSMIDDHNHHEHRHPDVNHCHDESFDSKTLEHNREAMVKLIIGLTMCAIFMLIELIGGYLSHSLAIFTDAAHLISDLVSFAISLLAIYLGQKKPTQSNSFGYYRVEVIGVLFSVFLIWFITGILIYLAIEQIIKREFEINSTTMLIVSSIGLGVNITMMFVLSDGFGCFAFCRRKLFGKKHQTIHHRNHNDDTATITSKKHNDLEEHQGHSHSHSHGHGHSHLGGGGHSHMNMNVRAALLHIIGDIIQSLGVLIAAIIIHLWPHLKLADPICTLLFGVIIFLTTFTIMRDALHILMEGFPREFSYETVRKLLLDRVPLVVHVHSLHIWSLTHGRNALSVHLTVDQDNCQQVCQSAAIPAGLPKSSPIATKSGTPFEERRCSSPNQCFDEIRHIAESIIREELKINQTTIQVEFHQASRINSCNTCTGPSLQ